MGLPRLGLHGAGWWWWWWCLGGVGHKQTSATCLSHYPWGLCCRPDLLGPMGIRKKGHHSRRDGMTHRDRDGRGEGFNEGRDSVREEEGGPLVKRSLKEDEGSDLETSSGIADLAKRPVCASLFILAASTTGAPHRRSKHPGLSSQCGWGSGGCPCPQGQVAHPCFPPLLLCPEPPHPGRWRSPGLLGEEKNGASASRNAEEEREGPSWGEHRGVCAWMRRAVPGLMALCVQ